MKLIAIAASLILLTACSNTANQPNNAAEIGTDQWFRLVESQYPTSDGHGHGPDFGSQEWCDVVYFKMYGQRSAQPVVCNYEWFQFVDSKLNK